MIEIEASGTIVEFPDGTPPEVMKAALRKRFPQPADTAPILTDAAPPEQDAAQFLVNQPAQPAEQKPNRWLQGLMSVGQGLSFGTADELSARLSQMLGGDYQSALDSYRQQLSDTPAAIRIPGEIAGGIVTGIATAPVAALGLASKAGQALPKVAQVAGLSGAYGGLYGAGASEEGERLSGAAMGAGVGAVAGGALYGAGQGIKALGKGGKAGAENINQRLSAHRRPEEAATRALERAIADDAITPARMQSRADFLGEGSTLADTGGENVRGLLRAATAEPGPAKQAALTKLEGRLQGAQRRISQSIAKTAAQGDLDFDSAVMKLHENMRKVGEGYTPLMKQSVPVTDGLAELMTRPSIQSGIKQAARIAADEGDTAFREFIDINPQTLEAIVKKQPTLKIIDYVKRGLDDVIESGVDGTTGKLSPDARRALTLKRQLLAEVDSAAPEYATLRAAYADQKSAESALGLGRKFLRDDFETTARRIADMSGAEQQYFRMGAARALRDKVMQGVNSGSSFRSIYKSPLIREKVRTIFPDMKARQEFERSLIKEIRFADTRNKVLSGSRTAPVLAEMEGLKNSIGSMGAIAASGMDGGHALVRASAGSRLAKGLADKLTGGEPREFNRILSQMLLNQDPAKQAALLRSLKTMKPITINQSPDLDPLTRALAVQAGQRSGLSQ